MGLFDKNKLKQLVIERDQTSHRPCVLLVDDEDANLRVMESALGDGYDVLRASDGLEAWDMLQRVGPARTVACIVSDQRMPGLTGVELCERAFHAGFTAVRVIVTGFIDIDAIVDSINKAEIYKFIIKPFDTNDFRLTVRRAVEAFQMRAELDAYVRELEHKVEQRTAELQQAVRTLEAMSLTDALTGVANRRRFDIALNEEWQRAQRAETHLAVLFVDIDLFKGLNDTLGHAAGDAALKCVADLLQKSLPRAGDLVARHGGEEFAAILIGTTLEGAALVAQRIVETIRKQRLPNPRGLDDIVTVSIGVAMKQGSASAEALMNSVDHALYQAKNAGRDRIAIAAPGDSH